MDENGNPYTPVTRESVIAEYNEEQKAACEAWNVEMLTDIFPQPDEFENTAVFPTLGICDTAGDYEQCGNSE